MPTVRRFSGLRVAIYPNDHRPALCGEWERIHGDY